jgi:hypothetical protein
MTAPLSLIVSAFAPVTDAIRRHPDAAAARSIAGRDRVWCCIDLGREQDRLGRLLPGAGVPAHRRRGRPTSTMPSPELLLGCSPLVQELRRAGGAAGLPRPLRRRPGGHDAGWRWPSPGAAAWRWTSTLFEGGRAEPLAQLFSEEIGAVVQVASAPTCRGGASAPRPWAWSLPHPSMGMRRRRPRRGDRTAAAGSSCRRPSVRLQQSLWARTSHADAAPAR